MLKVLMVIRPDIYEKKGGDYFQLLGTKKYLEKMGVNVTFFNSLPNEKYKFDFDIVHLFNLQTAEFSYKWVKFCKKNNIPLVLSPIYWKEKILKSFKDITKIKYYKLDKWILKNLLRDIIGNEKYFSKKYKLQKFILKCADLILPNSFIEKEHLEKKFRISLKDKSFVVYNGIDNEIFPNRISKKENILIQVGAIGPTKNQLTSIKATLKMNIDFYLIGRIEDIEYFKSCKKLSEKRKGRTFFIDEIKQNQIINFYNIAKIHVLPSWRETPGLANLEAGAMGCYIITTERGSAREYFSENAHYCEPFDIEGLKSLIEKTIEKKEPNYNLAEMIRKNFTWEKSAIDTLNCYKKLI